MFINWEEMVSGHLGTTMCKSGGKLNYHHLSATAVQVAAGTEFQAEDQVLEKLDTFNYLGRILSFDDRDLPVVTWDLHKNWSKWGWLSCLICQKGG